MSTADLLLNAYLFFALPVALAIWDSFPHSNTLSILIGLGALLIIAH